MNVDISAILSDWSYEPGQVNVRRIRGDGGRELIQLRLDLGLLQMETSGRPDGKRPEGHESLLAYYEHLLQTHKQDRGSDDGFELDERACELLRAEGLMYYHRYIAEFVLEDYLSVERDAMRNIKMFDFCGLYAIEEADRVILEQYRPYVLMMFSRARAGRMINDNRPRAAISALRKGSEDIREFFRKIDQPQLDETSGELAILNAMIKEIEISIPADPLEQLRKKLTFAIKQERYEDAATIRDKIRQTGLDVEGPRETDG